MFDDVDGGVTETSTQSWFSRIGESIKGIGIGLLLAIATIVGLFWNEGRAVTTTRSLNEGQAAVVAVPSQQVSSATEGRLVYLTGDVTTKALLKDDTFGVSTKAIRLERKTEMYQWHENEETKKKSNLGGSETTTTHYTYERKWSDKPVDSSQFKRRADHENPAFRHRAREETAADAELGAFRPGRDTLARIEARDELQLTAKNVAAVRGEQARLISDRTIYLGADPANPRVGDMRIGFMHLPNGPVSLIGRQTGSNITPFQTRAGDKLLLTSAGTVSTETMFASAHEDNMLLTWALRILCVAVMWFGFYLILRPVMVLGDVVPVIGSLFGAGAAVVAGLVTLVVAPLTFAIAWFIHRPLMATVILATALAAVYALRRRGASPATPVSAPGPVMAPTAPTLPDRGNWLSQPRHGAPAPAQPAGNAGGSFLQGHRPLRQARTLVTRQPS